MTDPIATGLLERAFADDCTAAERAALEQWIAADPSRAPLVALLREAWANAGHVSGVAPLLDKADIRTAWQHVASRAMGQPASTPGAGHTAGVRPHRWPRRVGGDARPLVRRRVLPFAVGAVTAGVLVTAAIALVRGDNRRQADVAGHAHEYATRAGERTAVTLPDGTQFTLGPVSRLRLAADYGRARRDVSLDGEAYFVVAHDTAHPFTVRAANTVTMDIGTRFDVRAYPDDHRVRIAVAEGMVALRTPTDLAALAHPPLTAGDVASVDSAGVYAVAHVRDVGSILSWHQGGLMFDHTPLSDAIRDLHRAFDVDITVADSTLLTQHITASFGEAPVDEVLEAVAFAVGASYERAGRRVMIRRQAPSAQSPVSPPSGQSITTLRGSGV